MRTLRNMNTLPPEGYAYEQPGTGMKFDGNEMLKPQANKLRAYRLGNNLARSGFDECVEDIIGAVCGRYPDLCIDTAYNPAIQAQARQAEARCSGCGGRKA